MSIAVSDTPAVTAAQLSRRQVAQILLACAVVLALTRPILPDWIIRQPDWTLLPWDIWLQAIFDFVKDDLGLIHLTRFIAGILEFLLDATANLLYGKRRWPNIGPIPWPAIAAAAAVLGYWLGGWKMAVFAGGTFIWTALVGQWKWAMETLSVIVVAAPIAFFAGLGLGILAWRSRRVEAALLPILSVLQTLPFFTYLLPAVIFFKVGPTAACVGPSSMPCRR